MIRQVTFCIQDHMLLVWKHLVKSRCSKDAPRESTMLRDYSESAPRATRTCFEKAPRMFRDYYENAPQDATKLACYENAPSIDPRPNGMLQDCSENATRLPRECSENAPRVLQECSENAPSIFREYYEKAPRMLRAGSVNAQGMLREHAENTQRTFQR